MKPFRKVIDAASGLSGPRLQALVVSSIIATAAVIASALGNGPSNAVSSELLARLAGTEHAAPAASPSTGPESVPIASPAGPSLPAGPVLTPQPPQIVTQPDTTPTDTTPTDTTPTDTGDDDDGVDVPDTDTGPEPASGRVKHIFVIDLASPGYEEAFGDDSEMPYLAEELRPEGALLSKFSLLDESPLPNLVATISGQRPNKLTEQGCLNYKEFPEGTVPDEYGLVPGNGCVYPVQTLTIADQLTASGLLWRGYAEDQHDQFGPGNCVHPDPADPEKPAPGEYDPRWNPFVFFHSLLDLGDCATNDVPLTELKKDLREPDTTPNFALISPTPCNAGVIDSCPVDEATGDQAGTAEGIDAITDATTTVEPDATTTPDAAVTDPAADDTGQEAAAQADAFLRKWVPLIRKSPAFKADGLLVITFAQAQPADGEKSDEALNVGSLLLGKYALAGSEDGTEYTPYSVVRSAEEILGFAPLAQASASDIGSFAAGQLGAGGGGD